MALNFHLCALKESVSRLKNYLWCVHIWDWRMFSTADHRKKKIYYERGIKVNLFIIYDVYIKSFFIEGMRVNF